MGTHRHRPLIGLLGALSAFGPLALDVYLPGLPRMADDLNAPTSAAQLTVTACLIGLGAGQLAAGPISDVLGRRAPLLCGLVLFVATSLGCAFAPSVWPLVGIRFVQGAAGAAGVAIARAIVRDRHEPAEATRLLAVLFAVNSGVPIFAPIVGGQLLHVTDWRGVFVVLAAIGAVMVVASFLIVEESLPATLRRSQEPGAARIALGALLHDRLFIGCVLASGFAMAAMFAYIAGSPFVLEDIHDLSPQTYSLVFGANAVGILGAVRISMRLTAQVGARRLIGLGSLASATGGMIVLVDVAAHLGLGVLLVGLFVIVASVGLVTPNASGLALAGHPSVAGTASGIFGMTGFLLGAAVAPLVGIAGSHDALPMAILIAATSLVGLVVARVLVAGPGPRALVDSAAIPAAPKARPQGGHRA